MSRRLPGRFILGLVLALVFSTTIYSDYAFQKISKLTSEVNLDSSTSDSWYAAIGSLNAKSESATLLKEQSKTQWVKVPVPSNLIEVKELTSSFETDFAKHTVDFLAALFTFSEPENYEEKIKNFWYMKMVKLPQKIDQNIVLRLGRISDRDEAWFNGYRLGGYGKFDHKKPQAYDKIRLYEIPSKALRPGELNVILVKTQNYFIDEIGIMSDYTAIGPATAAWRDFYQSEYFKIILLVLYFTAGVYFMFLFVRRRQDKEYFFYAAFTLFLVTYQFFRTQIKFDLGLNFFLFKKIEYMCLPMLFITVTHFTRTFFRLRYHLILKVLDTLFALVILSFLLHPSIRIYNFVVKQFFQFLYPLSVIYMMYVIIRFVLKRNQDAYIIISGALVMVGCLVVDTLSNNSIINFPRVAGYGFILFVMGLAGVLANRFVRLNRENEELNQNLEKKVEQRTEELQRTLNEVRTLKVQQDGDYFLTSLLIKPLGVNRAESSQVKVEFLVRQKKQFQFKKWQAEIGGDLCIAHSINLLGKPYTVFLNGDAMGKSIQGAGGALVLGVVFNSVIARTQVSSAAQAKYPENWLRDAFLELQTIFVNFDGSMLISVMMGMVDDQTGLMYYINAEHPFSVLYRDGRAEFIERDDILRKIGIEEIETELQIKTFQLSPRDVLIMGSDGRDDLLLGTDEQGSRIINEDETAFLKRVEESSGQLENIAENLLKFGELTDDLTLLRISYFEDYQGTSDAADNSEQRANMLKAAQQAIKMADYDIAVSRLEEAYQLQKQSEILLLLVKALVQDRQFEKAARFAEDGTAEFPAVIEFSYLASKAYKASRRFKKAADHGERVRLRHENNVNNLLNLADVYRLIGNRDRALMLVELARQFDANNANLKKLEDAID